MAKLDYEKQKRKDLTRYAPTAKAKPHLPTAREKELWEWLEQGCAKHERQTPRLEEVVFAVRTREDHKFRQALKIAVETKKVADDKVIAYACGVYRNLGGSHVA